MKNAIASLAVFRELYDKEKDIYDVLCQFITNLINETNIDGFSTVEITNKLTEYFKFKIPESVVKSSLRRLDFVKPSSGNYVVDRGKIDKHGVFDELLNKKTIAYDKIILKLDNFIQQETKKPLSLQEKLKVESELHNYLLDETDTRTYTKYIAIYLLSEQDNELLSVIQTIREGLILQAGINYSDISQRGAWKTNLTIYIDTEVLFNMAGYDGDLYKLYFTDFHNYVREINLKQRKNLIELKYFPATKKEIDLYFRKAQDIVSGKDILNPPKNSNENNSNRL